MLSIARGVSAPRERADDSVPVLEALIERLDRDAFVEAMGELVFGANEGLADAIGRDASRAVEEPVRSARPLDRNEPDPGTA